MTIPNRLIPFTPNPVNPFVLDGEDIKVRLHAAKIETQSHIHIDWMRFTCWVEHLPYPDFDTCCPPPALNDEGWTLDEIKVMLMSGHTIEQLASPAGIKINTAPAEYKTNPPKQRSDGTCTTGSKTLVSKPTYSYVRPSLDDINRFFVDALARQGLKNDVWEDQIPADLLALLQQKENPTKTPKTTSRFVLAAMARELAVSVATALGPDFFYDGDVLKGMDFYAFRLPIKRNGIEVGWVGFGSSSDKARQKNQEKTIHCNLHGSALTFAAAGWQQKIKKIIDETKADITRVDLALDFFDGYQGGIIRVRDDYIAGKCNVLGKKPSSDSKGDWANGRSRSLYIGTKKSGKETNIYEKGDQLYGLDACSPWLRFELRYGNQYRFIDSDVLINPDSYFAGASEWHASVLAEAGAIPQPIPIPIEDKLQDATVDAAVRRVMDWAQVTLSPTLSVLLNYLSIDQVGDFLFTKDLPGRLKPYTDTQLAPAFRRIADKLIPTMGLPATDPTNGFTAPA